MRLQKRPFIILTAISILLSSTNVMACALPLGQFANSEVKKDVPYLSYGHSENFTERSIEAEYYCGSQQLYSGFSIVQLSTPAMPANYAMYWNVGWTGRFRYSYFVEYGLDLIEFGMLSAYTLAARANDIQLDQRFSAGFVYRRSRDFTIRIYYRDYRINGPKVSDGRYSYYGLSFSSRKFM